LITAILEKRKKQSTGSYIAWASAFALWNSKLAMWGIFLLKRLNQPAFSTGTVVPAAAISSSKAAATAR